MLTYKNIGSVSKPYFNSKGAAYVVGVRDSELQQLRDTDLPTYIRVHTAGAESDYMVSLASERLLTFEEDDYRTIGVEYLFRKISTFSYYFTSIFKRFSPNLKEETNELKRDIVGHDLYGAVRHLHRPEMPFYRYTDYEDLTSEERKFIRRVGYRSIFTLLNPQFVGKKNFTLSGSVKANIGFGYRITPFGDMIDNNIWIMYTNDLKLLVQNRLYQNRDRYFYGISARVFDYPVGRNFWVNVTADVWNQPRELEFSTHKSTTRALVNGMVRYKLTKTPNAKRFLTADLGLQYKTFGFVPEEVILEEAFTVRLGITYTVGNSFNGQ